MKRLIAQWSRHFHTRASALVASVLLMTAGTAHAYCRSTSCEETKRSCPRNAHLCMIDGAPLFWPDGSVDLDVDSKGSALRGITEQEFENATSAALKAWTAATCPHGGHPAIHARIATSNGASPGYVPAGPNENLVILIDERWPQAPNDLGKTLLAFGIESGELYDADIELNSEDYAFAVDAGPGEIDLQAVLTHEIGHVLGLDHSDVPGATMQPETPGFATIDLRTLADDDVAGICAIYPPAPKTSPGASAGDSGGGCDVGGRGSAHASAWPWVFVALCLCGAAKRRGSS